MTRRGTRRILSLLATGLLWSCAACAAPYRFSIPAAEVTVTIEPAGSALIHYKLTFVCAAHAHPIDVVDIGMPTRTHEALGAALNGMPLADTAIRKSTAIANGYETHLGEHTISAGTRGVFEFKARSHGMVWQDTTHRQMASFRFSPTWFGQEYVRGDTELLLRYRLPPGSYADPDRMILWHKGTPAFQLKGVLEGENVPSVVWRRRIRMTRQHLFGVSFPKAFVQQVRSMSVWQLLYKWFTRYPERQLVSGLIVLALFSAVFLFATRFTGCALFIALAVVLGFGMAFSPVFHLCMYPALLVLGGLAFWYRRSKKMHYIPASISREGGRVHSGLSAVEAAVLLDVPVNRILTMLIFELARRGLVKVTAPDPLKLDVTAEKDGQEKGRWRSDGRVRRVTRYEDAFLSCFAAHRGEPIHTLKLDACFEALLEQVTQKLEGCDLRRTRDYCRFKVTHAWKRVREEADFDTRTRYAEKNQGWLMNDPEDRAKWATLERTEGYYFRPWWYYGHGPRVYGVHGAGISTAAPAAPVPAPAAAGPAFRDVVDSVLGRLQNLGSTLESLPINQTNSIDLSALDRLTNQMLESGGGRGGGWGGSGGGFGGGFGGGCACACAGCACACACAGGGR